MIIQLNNDRLWSYRVEEELKEFSEKKEHISQIRSKAGKKGAQAKTHIKQSINNFAEANGKQNDFAEINDVKRKEKIPTHPPKRK
ncbi:hypothetical protein V4P56_02695 [Bartonella sp. B35(2025)]